MIPVVPEGKVRQEEEEPWVKNGDNGADDFEDAGDDDNDNKVDCELGLPGFQAQPSGGAIPGKVFQMILLQNIWIHSDLTNDLTYRDFAWAGGARAPIIPPPNTSLPQHRPPVNLPSGNFQQIWRIILLSHSR